MDTRVSRFADLALVSVVMAVVLGGCGAVADWTKTDAHRLLSPDKVIEAPDRSPINPILSSTSLVDQSQELVPNATFPQEGDWEYIEKDYVIGPTDVLIISILDLFQEGLETPLRREVSDTGYIDLPLLTDRIKAEGLTKDELAETIVQAYSPHIIRDPTVSVTIEARRQRTYYILGAVARPSQYMIQRRDMRLLEALAIAGGVVQNNIPYLYVIRPAPAPKREEEAPVEAEELEGLEELPEPLPVPEGAAPETEPAAPPALQPAVATQPKPPSPESLRRATEAVEANDIEAALRELGRGIPTPKGENEGEAPAPSYMPRMVAMAADEGAAALDPAEGSGVKWVYRNGKWVRVTVKPPVTKPAPAPPVAKPKPPAEPAEEVVVELPPTAPAAEGETAPPTPMEDLAAATKPTEPTEPSEEEKVEDPFGWREASKSDMARIIAINLQKLNDGDPRQNIVIRDNDIIHVPYLPVGEFYVTGEVLRPGVYSLPSTPVTIKQALSAAGNVGPLAWPENSILIRRIGRNQEQIIPINVEAIFRGEEPDVFLKPNDVIAVGTDVRAPFYAVLRNAFRMTYGFGFIYDRNFSDPLTVTPTSNRFTRW